MNLIELKRYMMQVKVTTLANLCAFFRADQETIRSLLEYWIRKGNVRQCQRKPACGTRCFKCPASQTEIYEWLSVAVIK